MFEQLREDMEGAMRLTLDSAFRRLAAAYQEREVAFAALQKELAELRAQLDKADVARHVGRG